MFISFLWYALTASDQQTYCERLVYIYQKEKSWILIMKEVNKRNNILILFKLIPLEKEDYIFSEPPPLSLWNSMLFMNRSSHMFNLSFILRKTCFFIFY